MKSRVRDMAKCRKNTRLPFFRSEKGNAVEREAIVVIRGGVVQFHCMDSAQSIASAPVLQKDPIPRYGWLISLGRYFNWVISAALIGVVIAIASVLFPASRVVVFNQAQVAYVKLTSVRLAKPGFVVLYTNDAGSKMVEADYLPAGYYRNYVMTPGEAYVIDRYPEDVYLFVRLYIDDGDRIFDDTKDQPVKDIYGHPAEYYFGLHGHIRVLQDAWFSITDHPFRYIADVLLP